MIYKHVGGTPRQAKVLLLVYILRPEGGSRINQRQACDLPWSMQSSGGLIWEEWGWGEGEINSLAWVPSLLSPGTASIVSHGGGREPVAVVLPAQGREEIGGTLPGGSPVNMPFLYWVGERILVICRYFAYTDAPLAPAWLFLCLNLTAVQIPTSYLVWSVSLQWVKICLPVSSHGLFISSVPLPTFS